MKVNILQLKVFKKCNKEYNLFDMKCRNCIAFDMCSLVDRHEYKLKPQKFIDDYVY